MKTYRSKRTKKAGSLLLVFSLLLGMLALNMPNRVYAEEVPAVANPGFENIDALTGQPAEWTISGSTASVNSDAQYVRTGSNSLKITDISGSTSVTVRSNQIPVQPGIVYEASVYCYRVSGTPQLYLEFYNSGNTRIGVVYSGMSTTNEWSKITAVEMAPLGTAYAKVLLYSAAAATCEAYFDDAAILVKQNEIQNPGFELSDGSMPVSWTSSPLSAVSLSYNMYYEGAASLKLTDNSSSSALKVSSRPVSVRTGSIYEASVYCYCVSGTSQLYLEFYDSGNTRIGMAYSGISVLNSWTKIMTTGMAPEGTAYAKLLLYSSSTGLCEAYFDNAGLEEKENAVQNPGFELPGGGTPSGWTCAPASAVSLSTETFYEGTKSLRITDTSSSTSVTVRSSSIPVQPGKLYEASVYSFNESGVSQMYIEYYNNSGARIDVKIYSNEASGVWKKITGRRQAPANASYAKVLLYSNSSNTGVSYYDKVSFTRLESTLVNGGFEYVAQDKPIVWVSDKPGSIQASTQQVNEGMYSLRINDNDTSSAVNIKGNRILVSEDNVHEASVYIYNQGGGAELSLEYYDADDTLLTSYKAECGTEEEWQLINVQGTAPLNTSYMTVGLASSVSGTGTIYFDSTSLNFVSEFPIREFPLAVTGHPRLFFTAGDIQSLIDKAADTNSSLIGVSGQSLWSTLESTAREYLTETSFTLSYYNGYMVTYPLPPQQPGPMSPPPGYTAGAYPYWTGMARAIQQRIETLSLAYCVTGETAFAERAKEYALAVAGWNVWSDPNYLSAGAHTCLDTAHLTFGVSAAYDMLYSLLIDSEKATLEQALTDKGLEPLFADSGAKLDHNLQMLRACALGTGAIALMGKNPNANKYLTRATNYYKWYLDSRMSSGQQEGLNYTSYSMENLMRVIDQLSRATGERDLIEHPFINDFIIRWAVYSLIPGGTGLANFSDSSVDNYFYITMNVAGKWLNNGYAGWYLANARPTTTDFEKFMYLDPGMTVTSPDNLEESAVLDEIGWASLRSGWEKNDTMLEFVSNNSQMGHNHYDQNSFIIGTNSSVPAADPGYQDYSAGPGNEFTLYYGHSTIYVDGQAQNVKGGGEITEGLLSPYYDYVTGSAAGAYTNPSLSKFDRHIVNIKNGCYVILDDLQSGTPRTFSWTMYTGNSAEFKIDGVAAAPGQSAQGNQIYIHKGNAQLAARFLASNPLPISIQNYTGAEAYGPYIKAGSGTAATDYKYLTVIKAGEYEDNGIIKALDLGAPIASSGKEYKSINVYGSNILFYKALEVNDYITLEFNVNETAEYNMSAFFAKSPMYGTVQVYVDGQPAGNVYDGYGSDVALAPEFTLGAIQLAEGNHQIKFQVTGKNENSGGYYIGIDSIKYVPADGSTTEAEKISVDADLLQAGNVIGAEVRDSSSTSYVLFKTSSEGSYSVGTIQSNADQLYIAVNDSESLERFAIARGSSLSYSGKALLTGNIGFSAAIGYNNELGCMDGIISAPGDMTVGIYTGSQASVLLDGQLKDDALYNDQTGVITVNIPAGRHKIKIEDTAPALISVYANDAVLTESTEFKDLQSVKFSVYASDSFSGVSDINIVLDGKPFDNGTTVDFKGLPCEHVMLVTVTDKAKNITAREYKFNVVTDMEAIGVLLEYYKTAGDLKQPLLSQLENCLAQAKHQYDKGSLPQASRHMEDFVKHLGNNALSGYVSESATNVLEADAKWLIDLWKT